MKRIVIIFLVLLGYCLTTVAQPSSPDSSIVWAKKWSRDKNRNIVISEWAPFKTIGVTNLKHQPSAPDQVDLFGGSGILSFKATGFFRTEKTGDRFILVNPLGKAFIAVALNSVRQGGSPFQKASFAQKFPNDVTWMKDVRKNMDDAGFNMLGSWSDTSAIRAYNRQYPDKPIAYTTQLSLLAGFSQQQNKQKGGERRPVLSYVFHPDFEKWSLERCRKSISGYAGDPWLVGHFSDNELPFQENILREFMRIGDPSSPAYQLAAEWAKKHQLDTANIPRNIQEEFAGVVAAQYYKIVAHAIKTADRNHLYIGSRLHAGAKSNPHMLSVSEQYMDVISINYYGNWSVTDDEAKRWNTLSKPFMITEFYTKGEDSELPNITGAGWLVRTQADRGRFYQNFCLKLLSMTNCVGWHWFRYQDNDPTDPSADPSNSDSNKGIVNSKYETYLPLIERMHQLNTIKYFLIFSSRQQ